MIVVSCIATIGAILMLSVNAFSPYPISEFHQSLSSGNQQLHSSKSKNMSYIASASSLPPKDTLMPLDFLNYQPTAVQAESHHQHQKSISNKQASFDIQSPPTAVFNTLRPDGTYAFGYETPDGQSRTETTLPDGTTQGSYAYRTPDGHLVSINYSAGRNGFITSSGGDGSLMGSHPIGIDYISPSAGNNQFSNHESNTLHTLAKSGGNPFVMSNNFAGSMHDGSSNFASGNNNNNNNPFSPLQENNQFVTLPESNPFVTSNTFLHDKGNHPFVPPAMNNPMMHGGIQGETSDLLTSSIGSNVFPVAPAAGIDVIPTSSVESNAFVSSIGSNVISTGTKITEASDTYNMPTVKSPLVLYTGGAPQQLWFLTESSNSPALSGDNALVADQYGNSITTSVDPSKAATPLPFNGFPFGFSYGSDPMAIQHLQHLLGY